MTTEVDHVMLRFPQKELSLMFHQALFAVAVKEPEWGRYNLHCVELTIQPARTSVAATDGIHLSAVTSIAQNELMPDPEHDAWPDWPNKEMPNYKILIDAKQAKKLAGMYRGPRAGVPRVTMDLKRPAEADNEMSVTWHNSKGKPSHIKIKNAGGRFPQWSPLIQNGQWRDAPAISGKAVDLLRMICPEKEEGLVFEVENGRLKIQSPLHEADVSTSSKPAGLSVKGKPRRFMADPERIGQWLRLIGEEDKDRRVTLHVQDGADPLVGVVEGGGLWCTYLLADMVMD